MTEQRIPLIGNTLEDLQKVAAECGMPKFAAKQIADWLYVKKVTGIDAMTNLSKVARKKLGAKYTVGREAPLETYRSGDGTDKYIFAGVPGRNIEAVMIPDKERATLCVSCQAGCRMNCAFCMTGRNGFDGNLTSAQIMNQILSVDESDSLTNIVFMGMGEPTDNLDAVLKTIEILTAPWGLAWSPKRITVSTIGNLAGLKRLLDETKVHIAISVHTPFAEERKEIMPVEKAWSVADVMNLLRRYDFTGQRRLSVEYTMWAGRNDDIRHARALARLLRDTHARVNLIRFHKIPGFDGATASDRVMTEFRDTLNSLGITATIRASRGEDIMAACGMLAGKSKENG
ncbi:MAG: 23S rRNA (adenine(2503)-C(2))-methyltransferase RlmN [Paramuribaculum sp.]|nr:23S rRNA (adenine(2503)-C(2))-methyltransferase RlmN [Paramuribaculum sp.]